MIPVFRDGTWPRVPPGAAGSQSPLRQAQNAASATLSAPLPPRPRFPNLENGGTRSKALMVTGGGSSWHAGLKGPRCCGRRGRGQHGAAGGDGRGAESGCFPDALQLFRPEPYPYLKSSLAPAASGSRHQSLLLDLHGDGLPSQSQLIKQTLLPAGSQVCAGRSAGLSPPPPGHSIPRKGWVGREGGPGLGVASARAGRLLRAAGASPFSPQLQTGKLRHREGI